MGWKHKRKATMTTEPPDVHTHPQGSPSSLTWLGHARGGGYERASAPGSRARPARDALGGWPRQTGQQHRSKPPLIGTRGARWGEASLTLSPPLHLPERGGLPAASPTMSAPWSYRLGSRGRATSRRINSSCSLAATTTERRSLMVEIGNQNQIPILGI